jgi:hypothetical protein
VCATKPITDRSGRDSLARVPAALGYDDAKDSKPQGGATTSTVRDKDNSLYAVDNTVKKEKDHKELKSYLERIVDKTEVLSPPENPVSSEACK